MGAIVLAGLALAVGLLVPSALAGQNDSPTSPLPVFELAERQEWVLRVTLARGGTVEGRVTEIVQDRIRLDGATFRAPDVAYVARRISTTGAARRGSIIGGFAGGAIAFFTLTYLTDDDTDESTIIAGTLGGAAIGALLGAFIGSRVDRGHTEWLGLWPAGAERAP
jgi:hypothetical protein